MHPEDDIRCVAAEYGLDASSAIARVRPFLGHYLELVFASNSFEIITGGRGCAAALAAASGLLVAARAFLDTDLRFPGAMLGLKVPVGASASATLYHRSLLPVAEATAHLARIGPAAADLPAHLGAVATLYGLGFSEAGGALRIKTYVLGEVGGRLGFRSLRLGPAGLEADVREYTPDAGGDGAAADHARRALGVERFGHVAHSKARATKVYVERVGAITTDYSAR